eukprot:scaffold17741_cov26-Tisochrysis_lutea.AAC.3
MSLLLPGVESDMHIILTVCAGPKRWESKAAKPGENCNKSSGSCKATRLKPWLTMKSSVRCTSQLSSSIPCKAAMLAMLFKALFPTLL